MSEREYYVSSDWKTSVFHFHECQTLSRMDVGELQVVSSLDEVELPPQYGGPSDPHDLRPCQTCVGTARASYRRMKKREAGQSYECPYCGSDVGSLPQHLMTCSETSRSES